MPFSKELPEWNKVATKPAQTKLDAGWGAEEKPPASIFNWIQNTTFQALKELQQNALHTTDHLNATDPHTQYATKTNVDSRIQKLADNAFKANDPADRYPNTLSYFGLTGATASGFPNYGTVQTFRGAGDSIGFNYQVIKAHDTSLTRIRRAITNSKPAWVASASYSTGNFIMPTSAKENGFYYKATTNGTNGTTEPAWPTSIGATVTDGGIVWRCDGTFWGDWVDFLDSHNGVRKSGGVMTGNLDISKDVPVVSLSAGRAGYSGLLWNATPTVDYGLQIRWDGKEKVNIKNDDILFRKDDGSAGAIWHEGNLPRIMDNVGNAQNIASQDLNNYGRTGFYMGDNMVNAPSPNWYYVQSISHNSLWATQRALDFLSNKTYKRRKDNGTWTPWEEEGGAKITSGSYAGDGTANRIINIGFTPISVYVSAPSQNYLAYQHRGMPPNYHQMMHTNGTAATMSAVRESGKWQGIVTNGFQLGSTAGDAFNISGVTHYYVAIG